MTPAEQVALDAMRSAWPEETVARMTMALDATVVVIPLNDYLGELAARESRAVEEFQRETQRTLEEMRETQRLHKGQTHTDHCWARLAWGDGECECGPATTLRAAPK